MNFSVWIPFFHSFESFFLVEAKFLFDYNYCALLSVLTDELEDIKMKIAFEAKQGKKPHAHKILSKI